MSIIQRGGYLSHDVHNLIQLNRLLQGAVQRAIGHIAHDDIRQVVHFAKVIDRNDVAVFQLGNDAHFSMEAL